MIKKELKFANLTFTMQVRHVFQVLRGVISEFYVLFPGSMPNHRPVWSVCGQLVKMPITLEPHGIFGSTYAYLYNLTLPGHYEALPSIRMARRDQLVKTLITLESHDMF